MALDTGGNVQVDFVWGNIPMQPNTQRGMAVLDPDLDSHDIVYGLWNDFPDYQPNVGYLD